LRFWQACCCTNDPSSAFSTDRPWGGCCCPRSWDGSLLERPGPRCWQGAYCMQGGLCSEVTCPTQFARPPVISNHIFWTPQNMHAWLFYERCCGERPLVPQE
jgi:hypothetical protein